MSAFCRSFFLVILFSFSLAAQQVGEAITPPDELLAFTPDEEGAKAPPEASEGIEIAEFEAPQGGGVGLYSPEQMNLPYELWEKVPEEQTIALMQELPTTLESQIINNLILRLLLVETARADLSESFLMARIDKLLEMGKVEYAVALLQRVPEAMLSEQTKQQRFMLRVLSSSNSDELCEKVNSKQAEAPNSFWQRYQIICLAKKQEMAKARLGVELLREQNNADESFGQLIESLIDEKIEPKPLTKEADIESFSWYALAGKWQAIEIKDNLRLQAFKAFSEWKPKEDEALSPPAVPTLEEPEIPLQMLQLEAEVKDEEKYKADMAYAMRRIWEKPLAIEQEQRFVNLNYKRESKHLSAAWRESVTQAQDNTARLIALIHLIRPFDSALSDYAVDDLSFLIKEMQLLGLREDAAALTEELIGTNEPAAAD